MFKARMLLLATPALMIATGVASAQYQDDHRDHGQFYNGVRDGGRNGQYYDQRRANQPYYNNDPRYNNQGYNDQRYNDQRYHQGGIGPGKGALIGGAGGAILGGLLGGGLKGSLIGGAAGAGIGAIAGKEHQNSQRRNDGYYPR